MRAREIGRFWCVVVLVLPSVLTEHFDRTPPLCFCFRAPFLPPL